MPFIANNKKNLGSLSWKTICLIPRRGLHLSDLFYFFFLTLVLLVVWVIPYPGFPLSVSCQAEPVTYVRLQQAAGCLPMYQISWKFWFFPSKQTSYHPLCLQERCDSVSGQELSRQWQTPGTGLSGTAVCLWESCPACILRIYCACCHLYECPLRFCFLPQ